MVCSGFREAVEDGQRLLLFIDWAETGYVLRQRLTAIVSMGTQAVFFSRWQNEVCGTWG
jgi:hypothetical protein